ncbi:MAG: hypothetical protein N3A63_08795 [Bacteroidetes bacterium]|nr:hypothetical protein [Bacteroidota bacterium]
MKVSSFFFEQLLRQFGVPARAIKHLHIVGSLADVGGRGFPEELFHLSAPMITRGLLNFAIFQMKREWIYPYWVHKQLDPTDNSFIPRSQNPLMINITHRNWTMLGSPHGQHEAIVDPRGVMTPLPREWSIDVYLINEDGCFFPSFIEPMSQEYDTTAPLITTTFRYGNHILTRRAFVDTTSKGVDVVFESASVRNSTPNNTSGYVIIAIRPFNPEGVAPISSLTWNPPRTLYVDHRIGVVFNEEPTTVLLSNSTAGDLAVTLKTMHSQQRLDQYLEELHSTPSSIRCESGLSHALCIFRISIEPYSETSIHWSVALDSPEAPIHDTPRSTWKVSFTTHHQTHQKRWARERLKGASITFGTKDFQNIFDANVLFLLQLHDDDFISPGPYLYHQFWFRDAVPMLHALNRLGYFQRVQQTLDAFPAYLQTNGFFKAPDGEWDSNGAVLWILKQYYTLTHRTAWLKNFFQYVEVAVDWILKKRTEHQFPFKNHRGLLPPSISAEHLGTVDQYYWDSFWSFAGIRSAIHLASALAKNEHYLKWSRELDAFTDDLKTSIQEVSTRLGASLIPASPTRPFDEGAIGSICGVYPLRIHDLAPEQFSNTVHECTRRYVSDRGFYHPFIHSGYNPYLTLQLAHAYLVLNNTHKAWDIALTILNHCKQPYSLPEALHPRTNGGVMGDGNHGWAAAEIVLFFLEALVSDDGTVLRLFQHAGPLVTWGYNLSCHKLPTTFGTLSFTLEYHSETKGVLALTFDAQEPLKPSTIEIYFPFPLARIVSSPPSILLAYTPQQTTTICSVKQETGVLVFERV